MILRHCDRTSVVQAVMGFSYITASNCDTASVWHGTATSRLVHCCILNYLTGLSVISAIELDKMILDAACEFLHGFMVSSSFRGPFHHVIRAAGFAEWISWRCCPFNSTLPFWAHSLGIPAQAGLLDVTVPPNSECWSFEMCCPCLAAQ